MLRSTRFARIPDPHDEQAVPLAEQIRAAADLLETIVAYRALLA
ncbi:hypothetical protein BH23GEM5_BH23GEM5_05310 [soil metagenome]